jgi:hypothetical protein
MKEGKVVKGENATIGLEFFNENACSACYRVSPNSEDISSFEFWAKVQNPDDPRVFRAIDEAVKHMEWNLKNISEFE